MALRFGVVVWVGGLTQSHAVLEIKSGRSDRGQSWDIPLFTRGEVGEGVVREVRGEWVQIRSVSGGNGIPRVVTYEEVQR